MRILKSYYLLLIFYLHLRKHHLSICFVPHIHFQLTYSNQLLKYYSHYYYYLQYLIILLNLVLNLILIGYHSYNNNKNKLRINFNFSLRNKIILIKLKLQILIFVIDYKVQYQCLLYYFELYTNL